MVDMDIFVVSASGDRSIDKVAVGHILIQFFGGILSFFYKIVYDCKCPEEIKKEYVIADSNHELTKMTAAVSKSHGINQKHSKCACCITPLIKVTGRRVVT